MNGASFYFWLANANLWTALAMVMSELHKGWFPFLAVGIFSFLMAAWRT